MSPIEIVSTLTPADWRAYQMAWAARVHRTTKASPFSLKTFLIIAVVSFTLATVLSMWVRTSDGSVPIIAFVLGAALAVATMIVAPEREVPGISANDCASPTFSASVHVI